MLIAHIPSCLCLQVSIINPRFEVMEKMILSKFVESVGKESFFLSIEDAIEARTFLMQYGSKARNGISGSLESP